MLTIYGLVIFFIFFCNILRFMLYNECTTLHILLTDQSVVDVIF